MMKTQFVSFLVGGVLLLSTSFGVQTRQKVEVGFETFAKGDFENLSLDQNGTLSPAPMAELKASVDGPIIWRAIPNEVGGFFLGTGNSGSVVEVDAAGEVSEVFNPEEILTRGLALGPDGALYVGTSPKGRIYRLKRNESGGWSNAEIFFDPPENYIWDLQFDENGNLFVATGQSARIYKLPLGFQAGKDSAVEYFQSTETHFSTLAFGPGGDLLVGSGPSGYVYRVTGPNEGFALYHADVPEIRSILPLPDGSIFFATFNSAAGRRPSSSESPGSGGGGGDKDDSEDKRPDTADPWVVSAFSSSGSEILKIDTEGFVELFWELPNIQIYDLVQDGQGGLFVGTGTYGRIFQVNSRTDWSLVEQLPTGGDVSSLLSVDGQVYAFSSNPSRVYRMTPDLAVSGEYLSEIIDGGQIVSWGRFDARDGMGAEESGELSIETRSGNTRRPDKTWSAFSALDKDRRITSPTARYLQYKVTWPAVSREDHTLRAVRIFYRMQNREPFIRRINVVPLGLELVSANRPRRNYDLDNLTGSADLRPFFSDREARQQLILDKEEAALTAGWDAADPNGDRLEFRVEIRGPGQSSWITLADGLRDPVYSMNLNGLEEGYYQLRVTANDGPDNLPGEVRSYSRVSDPILVDLTPPTIQSRQEDATAGSAQFLITVSDAIGTIAQVTYRLNGGPETRVLPVDGLQDQREEQFRVELNALAGGDHSLVFEARDENGNRATRQISFTLE